MIFFMVNVNVMCKVIWVEDSWVVVWFLIVILIVFFLLNCIYSLIVLKIFSFWSIV